MLIIVARKLRKRLWITVLYIRICNHLKIEKIKSIEDNDNKNRKEDWQKLPAISRYGQFWSTLTFVGEGVYYYTLL
jgi:hypothetical protein